MSLYIGIRGIIPASESYRAAFDAWHACRRANVRPPKELCALLGIEWGSNQEPNPEGAEVDVKQTGRVMDDGEATIDLKTLPPGVTKLRVYCSA